MSNDRKSKDIAKLQSAITDIDALSQEGFSEIAGIARLALKAMERNTKHKTRDLDDIVQVLNVIWGKADDMKNCINCEAENLGCSYISENTQRKINEVLEVSSHG